MYPLSHQDLTGTRNKIPDNSQGDLKRGMDRRRTASSRLSCISEHQKENTPSSEEEHCSPYTQTVKPPSLYPVRDPLSHRHLRERAWSSGESSVISPLRLDAERVDKQWKQDPFSSSWRCVACPGLEGKVEPMQNSPELLDRAWQASRRKCSYATDYRRAISGAGFDGPRSSAGETSSPDPQYNTSRMPSALKTSMPQVSRDSKSNTSGSVDRVKDGPRRRPQRGHNVSEASGRENSMYRFDRNALPIHAADKDTTEPSKSCKKSQSRRLTIRDCPVFGRLLPAETPATSRYIPNQVPALASPDYSEFKSDHHRRRFNLPSTVSKRYRSLRQRLRRDRPSSPYSIRPEYPPPPDAKERRYRSRNSNEIWPSSGEESPIFNTPVSIASQAQPTGHGTSLLAASGLLLAAADIDRLTGSAYEGNRPRLPGTKSLELPRLRSLSGAPHPTGESRQSAVEITPIVPANSPSSLLPPARSTIPTSISPQWLEPKSRGQPSRLSEVTTPDDVNSSRRPSNSSVMPPQLMWAYSEPHYTREGTQAESQGGSLLLPPQLRSQTPSPGVEPNVISSLAVRSDIATSPSAYVGLSGLTMSRRQTPEPSRGSQSGDEGDTRAYVLDHGMVSC
ncbi:hypothetical protein F4808DRAFT_458534 [Astrocystis sublimbata]|nr:hypothetical protein F4808DRAFT_458534 [Astrocystis sublimbata]